MSLDELSRALAYLRRIIEEQADDEALWSLPLEPGHQRASEAHLQAELRRLHAAVEDALEADGQGLEG